MPLSKPQHAAGPYEQERKYRRFDLQFPVRLSFASNGSFRKLDTVSRNVNIGGLLLRANDSLPPGTQVSLTIEGEGHLLRRPVQLFGEGEVVRVEQLGEGAGFAIAIKCKRPLAQIEIMFWLRLELDPSRRNWSVSISDYRAFDCPQPYAPEKSP